MAADAASALGTGEGGHRAIEIELREVQDEVAHPAVVIGAAVAGVDGVAVEGHRRTGS